MQLARSVSVPLAALARPAAHQVEIHRAYGVEHEVHSFEVDGIRVFGATARILRQLLETWRKA